jgi:hypothetical protein
VRRALFAIVLAAAAAAGSSCGDPVNGALVDSLGPEQAGVPKGPLHRGGQPCLACHSDKGSASPQFSVAGTVYAHDTDVNGNDETIPIQGALITLCDATSDTQGCLQLNTPTNEAGNFYVRSSQWSPTYPMTVQVDYTASNGKKYSNKMTSKVYREGSCNFCHRADLPKGLDNAGHIYVIADPRAQP